MALFPFTPDRGFSKQTTPRVSVVQFGDGYAQRTNRGINNIDITWSLSFSSRTLIEAADIINFFEYYAGIGPFQFLPPNEATTYNVVASNWQELYESHISRTITVTFTRVFQ